MNLKALLKILILTILIVISRFVLGVEYNEMDVIPYARAVFDPNWISSDWYLGLNIFYRFPFSYFIGFFYGITGLLATVFLGRIVTYLLFSWAFYSLSQSLKVPFYWSSVCLMIFLVLFPDGLSYGEWMVGGLETKPFAYIFMLFSLNHALNHRHGFSMVFAGLALSFHVLVGVYFTFCLIVLFAYQARSEKIPSKELLKSSAFYFVGGFWGLITIIQQLFFKEGGAGSLGWEVYVNVRVPYHVVPKESELELVKLAILVFVLVLSFLKAKATIQKQLAFFGLVPIIFILIGWVVYFLDYTTYLRFYLFRFGDAVIPFAALMLSVGWLSHLRQLKAYGRAAFVGSLLFFIFHYAEKVEYLRNPSNYSRDAIADLSGRVAAMEWIKENSSKESVFCIPPSLSAFYLFAERAVFVSWKHAPQSDAGMAEWYRRMTFLAPEIDFKERTDFQDMIDRAFDKLSAKEFKALKQSYPEVTHVLTKQDLELPVIKRADGWTVYQLE